MVCYVLKQEEVERLSRLKGLRLEKVGDCYLCVPLTAEARLEVIQTIQARKNKKTK